MECIVIVKSYFNLEDASNISFRSSVRNNAGKFEDYYVVSTNIPFLLNGLEKYKETPIDVSDFGSYNFEICANLKDHKTTEDAINFCKKKLIKASIERIENFKKATIERCDSQLQDMKKLVETLELGHMDSF